jgi:cardiolipin synthase A/B
LAITVQVDVELDVILLDRGLWTSFAWTVATLQVLALISVPNVLLRRRGKPLAALAWLLALFALPGVGLLAWWAFGRTTIERRRRKRTEKKKVFSKHHGRPKTEPGTRFDDFFPDRARDSAFASRGNRVRLLADGREFFDALELACENAKRRIHVQMYIFEYDQTGRRFLELLERRAAEGLEVRVLLDGFGSRGAFRRLRRLQKTSRMSIAYFLPSRLSPIHSPRLNFSNHRKIVIVDDHLAFTGGMNIARQYEHAWRDLMLEVRGPAARSLHHVLLDDWYFATDENLPEPDTAPPFPDGDDLAVVASGPDTEPWIHDAFFVAITQAKRRILLVTPYFIPTPALVTALRTASARGVDVRVVLPSKSDVWLVTWASRSYYRQLVQAGVRIFEYPGPMLHAKALVQDDELLSVGTANVDSRSHGLSFEVSCFVSSVELNRQLSAWITELVSVSREADLESLDEKGAPQKIVESAAHLLSPLL